MTRPRDPGEDPAETHDDFSAPPGGNAPAQRDSSTLRVQAALLRLEQAERRERAARARDLAAEERDRVAAERERFLGQEEPRDAAGSPSAEARRLAAEDRARAAEDRARAAEDRAQARADRQVLRAALAEAQLDDLTGTFRRATGVVALQGEIERVRRGDGRLVLAVVDVDGLKAHNDVQGHAAGDRLLVNVVASMRANLRSYDPIVRLGGDEFVCALSDADLQYAHHRFAEIGAALERASPGASISVGFAQLEEDDTLESLLARADSALYDAKRRDA